MLMTALVLTAPFAIYALCYWLQSLREKTPVAPAVVRENHTGALRKAQVSPSGDTVEPAASTQRNRRKRKRKKK